MSRRRRSGEIEKIYEFDGAQFILTKYDKEDSYVYVEHLDTESRIQVYWNRVDKCWHNMDAYGTAFDSFEEVLQDACAGVLLELEAAKAVQDFMDNLPEIED